MTRADFITSRIGQAYDLKAANCWHLVAECQREVFGRDLPTFRKRDAVTRGARSKAAADSPAWSGWRETPTPADGAVVFMSRAGAAPDVHVGVYLDVPGSPGVLHTNAPHGVVFDDAVRLQARGWLNLKFYVPA